MMRLSGKFLAACAALGIIGGCGQQQAATPSASPADYEKTLRMQLETAKSGDVITIPEGTFLMTRSLVLSASGVTIKGAGMDKSVLSFKGQIAGAEGLLVNASNFTIEDVAIEDTKGDALKVNEGSNIVIRRVRTEWTGGPNTQNGAYGIYPVKCSNVLIEDSAAIGASDAGIYVGQSKNVIVRNNRAESNVAGIEIENTIGADVYGNTTTGNTGGILVFNMPNLSQPGHSSRVFKNKVFKNNLGNFAAKGAAVASVPAGAGVVVNSNSKVEIFDNDIADNQTANLIISAYFSTNYYNKPGIDPNYDPYPRAIYIYGNRFSGGGDSPDGLDLKTLKVALFGMTGHFPDVLWDGFRDDKNLVDGKPPADERLCVQNGEVQVLNADGPHKYDNPKVMDRAELQCDLPKLPPVELPGKA